MNKTLMILLSLLIPAVAFVVPMTYTTTTRQYNEYPVMKTSTTTQLKLHRRDFVISGVVTTVGLMISSPQVIHATVGNTYIYDDRIGAEKLTEPQQMRTGGKLDLNAAFVSEYKQFPGMYPHAAGMIASHGPYNSVKDIFQIPKLTDNDKALFKKYQGEFTVNPPGRSFKERINERVST